jgi:DNA topoisomerase-1
MSKTLIVVESPGKIKIIQSILGSNYIVTSCFGHIIDLDRRTMSIDIKNNFEPNYIPKPEPRISKIIKELKSLNKKCNNVLIATDKDREGEMIGWSIAHILKIKDPKRIIFTSITKEAIMNAVKNQKKLDYNMVDAAKTRRMLDRIVGYELSPILWSNIQAGLSAGRVQSVITRLIVDKEEEVKSFFEKDDVSYFKFKAKFPFDSTLYDLNGYNSDKTCKGNVSKINTKPNALKFIQSCKSSTFTVGHVFIKKSTKNPSPPFTTSTLQQEASRKLGFPVLKTMMSAQILYEAGLITYMRTDSMNLSNECMTNIEEFVKKSYGDVYYNRKEYIPKKNNTQEAHEAVRPSNAFTITAMGAGAKITNSEIRLYELIWKRTVASQMSSAKIDINHVQILISNDMKHYFQFTFDKITFLGYLKVYNIDDTDDDSDKNIDQNIDGSNEIKVGDKIIPKTIIGTQEYVKPITRYDEASLVNKISPSNLNIARPATSATMINVIQERKYVVKSDIDGVEKESMNLTLDFKKQQITEKINKILLGQEKNKFIPTPLGTLVNTFLVKQFPKIMDYKFTASMEQYLDNIASGTAIWNNVLDDFYKDFHPLIDGLKNKNLIKDEYTKILGKDPNTNYDIITTMAKYGPVVKLCGDSNQECKFAPIKPPNTLDNITLDIALKLLIFPIDLGKYNKKNVILQKGEHGLYFKYNKETFALPDEDSDIYDHTNIDIDVAILIIDKKISEKKKLIKFASKTHTYTILDGKYGKYIKVEINKKKKGFNIKLPNNCDINNLDLEKIQKIVDNKFKKIEN